MRLHPASLRHRFLLAVLAGAVLPLALIGLWLTSTAGQAGEELLRAQLEQSLAGLDSAVQERWLHRRSDLLLLAQNRAVQQALRRQLLAPRADDDAALDYIHAAYAAMQSAIESVTYADANGEPRWSLRADPAAVPVLGPPSSIVPAASTFSVSLDIDDVETGARLGHFEARVRTASVLPPDPVRGPAGTVLLVREARTGRALLPTAIDATAIRPGRFEIDGTAWLSVSRNVDEPPLVLVLAAPLDPYTRPFEESAFMGALALLVVAGAVVALAYVLSRRLTASLENLARAADDVSRGRLDRRVETDAADEIGRVAHAFNTMTESLRRTLRQLAERQALAAVGEFASQLAHEVRNPLTSLRIDLQIAEEKLEPDARAAVALRRALSTVLRLDATVTGALRVARSGRIDPAPINLQAVLEGAAHAARPALERRGAAVTLQFEPNVDAHSSGDAAALEQLFLNLLLNAAQAMSAGGHVEIAVRHEHDEMRVTIADDGPGIPANALPHVFEPFFTTRPDGTGLGLAVCQRIVAAHSGRIEIDTAAGAGTRVTVWLPAEAGTADGGRN
jgi:signal transduction histidine kinase